MSGRVGAMGMKRTKEKDRQKSVFDILPTITNMDIPLDRHTGLLYIMEKLSNNNPVTPTDVDIFLSDLGLPEMSTTEMKGKFKAARSSGELLSQFSEFFVFIANELRQHTEDEIFDAFDVFDSEEVRFLFNIS